MPPHKRLSKIKRRRRMGFLARMNSTTGRKLINRRRRMKRSINQG